MNLERKIAFYSRNYCKKTNIDLSILHSTGKEHKGNLLLTGKISLNYCIRFLWDTFKKVWIRASRENKICEKINHISICSSNHLKTASRNRMDFNDMLVHLKRWKCKLQCYSTSYSKNYRNFSFPSKIVFLVKFCSGCWVIYP